DDQLLVNLPDPLFLFEAPPPAGSSTLSLHDALPIWLAALAEDRTQDLQGRKDARAKQAGVRFARRFVLVVPLGMSLAGLSIGTRSEEHTSELQSRSDLVCRLLLEKKNMFAAIAASAV